jgi:hypothetical protein
MGRLYDDHGHADQAFQAWLRAAFHWTAAEAPEALAMRVAVGILGSGVGAYEYVADDIADTLTGALFGVAERAGVRAANRGPAVFRRVDTIAPGGARGDRRYGPGAFGVAGARRSACAARTAT